ncbi:MAG: 4Fe-4S binding protein [Anaerolineae bacterium]|nr:4Fe-4S binding protein [Anaerolineae bacterium]
MGKSARIMTGNEALALGALRAGVKVVTGYPGTPSSGALTGLLKMNPDDGRHIEWSTNEKVAFEIAAGAAWAGQRALCTMKMSGLNVAADAIASIAYSGINGGLVIYVADDSGVSAGMCEQDSRRYAAMFDLPLLEAASVAETYALAQTAFTLSEKCGSPVFLRLVTTVAESHAAVEVEDPVAPEPRAVILERDIARYTKAGSTICLNQHHDVIARLAHAAQIIREMSLNRLDLAPQRGGLGIVVSGVVAAYLEESLEIAARFGLARAAISTLRVAAPHPFPAEEARALLAYCDTLLVLEELEPHLEQNLYVEAQHHHFAGDLIGKLDGTLSRVGEYGLKEVVYAIGKAANLEIPEDLFQGIAAGTMAAPRPITCCAGCPHRGTYLAINQALKKLKLKKDQVMVTGDIGCTILGMNPPFHTIWNEVSMGTSISLAQGYVYAGIETPVIATIGDSTFFHGGIPGLINAIQHRVPLTLIIMDNGWTSMTGMQVNPGTDEAFQPGNCRVDIAQLIPALGVEHFFIMDPFELEASAAILQHCLTLPGVKVVLSRQECAIQAQRRGLRAGQVKVHPENCTLCRQCIRITGCPALTVGETSILIDPALCYGCGLCAQVCKFGAIERMTNDE